MMRLPDWRKRLRSELNSARKRSLKWGEHDCCNFGARCREAVTGLSAAELMRDFEYEDLKAAATIAKGGLRELIVGVLGEPEHWTKCGEGDLVLCEGAEDMLFDCILTVHDGAQLLAPSQSGLKRISMTLATVGWRLG